MCVKLSFEDLNFGPYLTHYTSTTVVVRLLNVYVDGNFNAHGVVSL